MGIPIAKPVYVDRNRSRIIGGIEIELLNASLEAVGKDRNRTEQNKGNNQALHSASYKRAGLCIQRTTLSIQRSMDACPNVFNAELATAGHVYFVFGFIVLVTIPPVTVG